MHTDTETHEIDCRFTNIIREFKVFSRRLFDLVKPAVYRFLNIPLYYRLKDDFISYEEPVYTILKSKPRLALKWVRRFSYRPIISVLVPIYNPRPDVLSTCLDSIKSQVYRRWELCIVDDASTLAEVRITLKKYIHRDSRIKVVFSDKNEGIAASISKAAQMASGEFVCVMDHDDELDREALLEFVKTINLYPDADCIYCDEDKIDEDGNYCDPSYKPDWNPDLSLSFNYVMHLAVFRTSLFRSVGGVLNKYEGSQDYDLLLRIAEKSDKIYHIPKVLYHWRMERGSIASCPEAKPEVFISGITALNDALARRGIAGYAEDAPDAWKGVYRVVRHVEVPLSISFVVLYSGNENALTRLLDSIFKHVPMDGNEVLVCSQRSLYPYENGFSRYPGDTIRLVPWDKIKNPKTIADTYNLAASQAQCEVLLFMDDAMELDSLESIRCLMEHIQRPEVGVVAGKVLYENGLLEHAGAILGPFNLVGYAHRATSDVSSYHGMKNMIRNFSAVMGFGMMTKKLIFDTVAGFNPEYENAYWDIDYCLRLKERGYLITYTPYSRFRHHIPVKGIHEMIVEPEASRFRKRWQYMIDRDPNYNPNLIRELEDFTCH